MPQENVLVMGPYPDWDMQALASRFVLHRYWQAEDKHALLAEHGPQIRAVATRGDLGANAALIDRLPALEMISCFGVGVDAIDLDHARARGIKVTNTPDVLTGDVADLAVGLMLAAARRIPQGDAYVRSGAWTKGGMALAQRMHGKRVGILGMGRIGRAIAKRLAGFDMQISYSGRQPQSDLSYPYVASPLELAQQVDFYVVSLSGGPATRGIVSADVIAALDSSCVLVNVSRGSVIDEPALLQALQDRTLGAAGLDVFNNEPDIDPRWFSLDNVVLQPHVASATFDTRRAMGQLVRDNLIAHFDGQPLLTPVP